MHLLTQGKHSMSALELKHQIGVSYETAWKVKPKLMQVMLPYDFGECMRSPKERERGRILSERIKADDAYMVRPEKGVCDIMRGLPTWPGSAASA